jgi:hypothetical protein
VLAKGEQPENTALAEAPDPVNPNDVRLMVDRKPHWQDLAPDLTRVARLNVLGDLQNDGLLSNCSEGQNYLLLDALTNDIAHLLSVRRIITELMKRKGADGSPVLPASLPVTEILRRFSFDETDTADAPSNAAQPTAAEEPNYRTEADYYNEALAAQDALGEKATIRLPAITPVLRRDKVTQQEYVHRPSIGQRIEMDKVAMTEAGVNYPVPPRRRSTQTYVPFHRLAAIPVREQVTRKKNYTIIRAESAVAALTTLLEDQPKAKAAQH